MTVRLAEPADLDRVVEMCTRFAIESTFRQLGEASPGKIVALAGTLGASDDGCVFIADVGGRAVGLIAGHVYVHPMFDITMASELVWWVDPEHRAGRTGVALLKAFEQWAEDHGATHVQMVAPDEKVGAFYARRKYTRLEIAYARRI